MNQPSKRRVDPELEEILGADPELLDLARVARSLRVEAPVAPNFEPYLRARLMDEAARTLRPRGLRRIFSPRAGLAGVGAAAGIVMTVAAIVLAVTQQAGPGGVSVPTAMSPIGGQSRVDPTTKAITISFNQPMDHASVVRALHIVPATSVTTSWTGDTLTITPTHGLSASTAYVVRIDNSVARSQRGVAPAAAIVVAFGTQPSPRPTPGPTRSAPAGPPVLTPTVLATTGPAADLVPGAGGRLLVTDVTAAGGATGASSSSSTVSTSSATSTDTGSSTQTGSATATASPSPAAPAGPAGLVSFGQGAPAVVGATASAAAISPTGRYVAAIQPDSSGAGVVVEGIDGSSPRRLARADAGSPVAWTQNALVLFVSGGHLRTVDLEGVVRSAGGPGGLTLGPGDELLLAPGGRWAYVAPGGSSASSSGTVTATSSASSTASSTASPSPAGTTSVSTSSTSATATARLVDLSSSATLPLAGAGTVAMFSADGGQLAWADTATAGQVDVLALGTTLPASPAPATIPTGAPAAISRLAIGGGGSRLAVTIDGSGSGGGTVRIVDSAGHTLGTVAQAATRLAFAGMGTVALVAGGQAGTVAIPGTPPATQPPTTVPDDAQALLDRLVAAQTGGGPSGSGPQLSGLPVAPGLDLAALTPAGATQGYVISVQAVPSTAQVAATIRLLSIPAAGSGSDVTFADETVTLDRPGGGTLAITQLTTTQMSPAPTGPHVVHVAATRSGGNLTVNVSFDSDLDPSTVARALTVGSGPLASAHATYDANSRTATLTVPLLGQLVDLLQPLTLTVSTDLRDVDGDALAQAYTASVTVTG